MAQFGLCSNLRVGSWVIDPASKEGIQGFPFERRGQIRSDDGIPRTGMGTPLLPLLPHGTTTVPTPLFPGIIFLHLDVRGIVRSLDQHDESEEEDPDRGCYYGSGDLDVCAFQSDHLWESVDEEALCGSQVVEDMGFLV